MNEKEGERLLFFNGTECSHCKEMHPLVGKLEKEEKVHVTELEVWQSYFDLQTAASSVASTANLVKSAGESAAAAAARYKAGVGSLLDLITAQLDDTNARVQQIQSYLDWYSALARLNFALGASDAAILRTRTP